MSRDMKKYKLWKENYYDKNCEKYKANAKLWYASNKQRKIDKQREWSKNHPIQMNAKNKVACAIASGDLTKQPCQFCGCVNVQAHHPDYAKPLDVTWLCNRCHKKLHKELKRTISPTDYSKIFDNF